MNVSEAVARRITELCAQNGITVNKLSTISAVTQSTVSDIVTGKAKNIGIVTIKSFAMDFRYPLLSFSTLLILRSLNRKFFKRESALFVFSAV